MIVVNCYKDMKDVFERRAYKRLQTNVEML